MLKSISSCPLMNMQNIYRYSGVKQSEIESLSSHIVEVQILGSILLNTLNNEYGENLDYGTYLMKALHHDLEESITGDITRPLKYNNEDIHRELDCVAEKIATNLYSKYFPDSHFFYYWRDAKEGKEGVLVKLVDMFVVAIKAFREVELLNNNYFLKVVHEVNYYLRGTYKFLEDNSPYSNQATRYLLSYISSILEDLQDLKDKYSHIYEEYQILSTTMVEEG